MSAPKVSIIIPVYNAQKVLRQCIDSCLGQSFREIEVILVNDASTDNCLSICEDCAKKDNRVVLIDKQQNEGVDSARFTGMEKAQGQYLMFVDADDWLTHSHVVSLMYEKAEETGVDYVEVGMNRVIGSRGWIKRKSISSVLGLIQQPELFDKYYISFFGCNILFVTMWGKLYRKSVIDSANLSPTGLKRGQDLAFNMQLFPYLHKVYITDSIGYNYRMWEGNEQYNPHLLPALKELHLLKEGCMEQHQYCKASDYLHMELKNVLRSNICEAIRYGNGTREDITERVRRELQDPVYKRMLKPYDHPQFYEQPFVKAIAAKDVETMYNICQEIVRKERPKRMLKRMASWLLR